MADPSPQSVQIQAWIDRLRGGDEAARDELLSCACERLRNLARKMLRGYPNVRRWEDTGDVLQNAVLRLHRTLQQMTVQTSRDFFRLAALNIRRELLDLARHYYGPQGLGARHVSNAGDAGSSSDDRTPADPAAPSQDPSRLAAWSEFHEQIQALPDEEREIFDLLWYQGLSQAEAGELLHISERTVKRRWQAARLKLDEALHGQVPE
jgi:RNA polymerase sigma-70 factor (ECF subfamily)